MRERALLTAIVCFVFFLILLVLKYVQGYDYLSYDFSMYMFLVTSLLLAIFYIFSRFLEGRLFAQFKAQRSIETNESPTTPPLPQSPYDKIYNREVFDFINEIFRRVDKKGQQDIDTENMVRHINTRKQILQVLKKKVEEKIALLEKLGNNPENILKDFEKLFDEGDRYKNNDMIRTITGREESGEEVRSLF